jgi:RNA polymerase sigma-70 factor (ECF subfamily)
MTAADASLVEKAKAGDASSFEHLVSPHRREILAHCYRLTGSLSDADDMAQEAMLRAWRGLDGFDGRASFRTWLYRIATNTCLTEIERRPRRELPDAMNEAGDPGAAPAPPILEAVWMEPCPTSMFSGLEHGPEARYSSRESIAVAFLAVIQHLPALQRAVLLFRDVLGWSAAETAESLETSVAAVNSALQRARETLEAHHKKGVALEASDARARELLGRYIVAWESGDVDALSKLLHEDAKLTMPPMPTWFSGRARITQFIRGAGDMLGQVRLVALEASGLPGVAVYSKVRGDDTFRAQSIHVLALDERGLARIDAFLDPSLFARFGLAPTLA